MQIRMQSCTRNTIVLLLAGLLALVCATRPALAQGYQGTHWDIQIQLSGTTDMTMAPSGPYPPPQSTHIVWPTSGSNIPGGHMTLGGSGTGTATMSGTYTVVGN